MSPPQRLASAMRQVTAALVALTACSARADEAPLARILITPSAMSENGGGSVEVAEVFPDVSAEAAAPLLSIDFFAPGLTMPQRMEDLIVTDDRGPVALSSHNNDFSRSWTAEREVAGTLTIRYRLPVVNDGHATGGPQGSPRIDGNGVSSVGEMLLMQPVTTRSYRLSLKWDLAAMGAGARGIWTYGEGDVSLSAGSLSRLRESFYMAGPIKREPEALQGAFSAVWTGEPQFDPRPALRWAQTLHGRMSHFFDDPREVTYRIFLRYNPAANAGGGTAFPNSFLWTYGDGITGEQMETILGHEMTHTWTATDMGKWFDEGLAVYYQQRLPWLAHMISSAAYLSDINKTAARYYTNELSHLTDAAVLHDYWSDVRLIVIPYDRGALYFAVLDSKIRKASHGRRSIDALIRVVVDRNRREVPTDEAFWVGLLRHELGDEGRAVHDAMMSGQTLVPDSEAYSRCFHRVAAQIRRYQLGYDHRRAAVDGVVVGMIEGSEADRAGIREHDRIILRTNTDGAQRDPQKTITVKITRDGRTFPITYLPRGEPVSGWQWELKSGRPDSGCRPDQRF